MRTIQIILIVLYTPFFLFVLWYAYDTLKFLRRLEKYGAPWP